MRNIFLEKKGSIAEDCLDETGWTINDVDHFFMHHVSKNTFDVVAASIGISSKKFYNVIEAHGNVAAASIPYAMSIAVEKGDLKKGDKVMLIGLAAGISISVQLLIW